jgi:outer membrane lipoprotein-sorting protein
MKKTALIVLLFGLAFGLIPTAIHAQSVQDVLDKMIAAQGGRNALAAVKDSTYTGSAEMVQFGMSGTITLYQKEPNKMRMDIEVMGMVITQAFDGDIGWYINPQTGAEELMNEQQTTDMKHQALGNDALLRPALYGITYELKPKETINGQDYIVVDQVFKDGLRSTFYVDPTTHLIYKIRTSATGPAGTEMTSEILSADYQKEGDLVVAKAQTIYQAGQEFVRLKFSKVVFNSGLEDQFFKKTGK